MLRAIPDKKFIGININKELFLKVFLFLMTLFISFTSFASNAVATTPKLLAAIPDPPSIPNITPATSEITRIGQRLEQPTQPVAAPQTVQKEKPRETLPPEVTAVKFKLNRIIIEGSTIYNSKQLEQYYSSYLGKEISLLDLQKIADDITARYRKDGYILSRAVLPAQKIENGIVVIKIVEGYVSEVYIEGNAKGAKPYLKAYAEKIKQMRPLQVKQLERYVLLLNDFSGLTVKSILSPSPTIFGAAELTFVTEQQKVAANVSYDNRGTRYLGPQEVLATLELDDPMRLADRIVLQTVDTPSNDELRFVQMNYTLPLSASGLKLDLNGNFAETHPGFILKDLDLAGRSKDWYANLTYPIIRSRADNLSVHGKFEWLDTNTDFVTADLFQDHIRSLRVGSTYDMVDKARGINIVNIEISRGLKDFGASPLDPTTPLSRFHGRSDYTKADADISRLQAIGDHYSLLAALIGQYSFNQPLLSAEQFAFGGSVFGRGYDPAEIIGDSGVAGKLEFRLDTNPDFRFLRQIQYYAFYDAGEVWNVGNNDAASGLPFRDSGTSTGGGVRVNLNKYLFGNLEATKPLTRSVDTQVLSGNNGKSWRFYFGVGAKL